MQVYGEVPKGEAELHEDSPLHPTNPYSASKACAEMMVRAYVKSYELPVVMIRLNNVYGPHQVGDAHDCIHQDRLANFFGGDFSFQKVRISFFPQKKIRKMVKNKGKKEGRDK